MKKIVKWQGSKWNVERISQPAIHGEPEEQIFALQLRQGHCGLTGFHRLMSKCGGYDEPVSTVFIGDYIYRSEEEFRMYLKC